MVYKPEHVVDLDTGAIVDVDIRTGEEGDMEDLCNRVLDAEERMNAATGKESDEETIQIIAADKGYYDTGELLALHECGIKTVVPDRIENRKTSHLTPDEKKAIRAARRSVNAKYGKLLGRRRSELVERSFQHTLDCGGARRTTLRGRENVLKRYLVQAACTNLSLLMRHLFGVGTPRQAMARYGALFAAMLASFGLHRSPQRFSTPSISIWTRQFRQAIKAMLLVLTSDRPAIESI
jgi:transposase